MIPAKRAMKLSMLRCALMAPQACLIIDSVPVACADVFSLGCLPLTRAVCSVPVDPFGVPWSFADGRLLLPNAERWRWPRRPWIPHFASVAVILPQKCPGWVGATGGKPAFLIRWVSGLSFQRSHPPESATAQAPRVPLHEPLSVLDHAFPNPPQAPKSSQHKPLLMRSHVCCHPSVAV